MRRLAWHPIAIGIGLSVLAVGLFWAGLYSLINKTLSVAASAERQRLLEAFVPAVASATTKGDDLGRIDELRRLQNIPGVVSAQMVPGGSLRIRLSTSRWKKLRSLFIQRFGLELVLFVLAGGVLGKWVQKFQRAHFIRLRRKAELSHTRHLRQLKRHEGSIKAEIMPWTHQAMEFVGRGLVLLNSRQVLVAANASARKTFGLSSELAGRHWLEIQSGKEWAEALDRSLQLPGELVAGPKIKDQSDVVLLSLLPEVTWIILGSPSSLQPTLIV